MTLDEVREDSAALLDTFKTFWVDGTKVSIIARVPGNDDADFILSDDSTDELASFIQRTIERENGTRKGIFKEVVTRR